MARLEKLGKPGVLSVAEHFDHDAHAGAADNGLPPMRMVVLPDYFWGIAPEQSKPIAEKNIDAFIKALTDPRTPEEINPKQPEVEPLPPIKILANSQAEALERFQRLFNEKQWSDGLALIPPTREAVDLMLTGTNRSPDEVIGKVKNKNGIATVEKVAINAVMAGASPRYLPVIIAAMEGLTAEDFDLMHPQASAGGFDMAVWVSGPLAEELGMNSGDRLWSYGNRANATIGRAIVLCRINLGHMWPGINDMARVREMPFTGFTFAENYQGNPWGPYHVIQGFQPEDSCVTVSTVAPQMTMHAGNTVEAKLNRIIQSILARRNMVFARYDPNRAVPACHPPKFIFMISPEAAAELNKLGYTQEKLRDFVYSSTSVPYEELSPDEIEGIQKRIKQSLANAGLLADRIPPERIPFFQDNLKPGGYVPILITPNDLHFVVAGGVEAGVSITDWSYLRAPYAWGSHKTIKVKGATLTKSGR